LHHDCHCDPCRCFIADQASATSASAQDPPPARSTRHRYRKGLCSDAIRIEEPPIGAHLVTPRRGYTHHGIYAGEGMVIHYAGLSRGIERGPVEEVSLARFANARPVMIRCRGSMPFEVPEIVRRARSRLGENRYRLLSNNCEHFSEWAQFGLSRSTQVDRLARLPMVAAASLARRVRVVLRSLSDRLIASHEGVANHV
jgi:hypothetical protein